MRHRWRPKRPIAMLLLATWTVRAPLHCDLARTGAHGFVEKTNSWDEFLHALEQVSHGEYYFCSHNAGIVPESRRLQTSERTSLAPHLTAREKEIIALIAQGFTSKEIAANLGISVVTVETHRTNVMTKIGVRNVAGIVAYAFRKGLARPGSNASLPVRRE